MTMLLLCVTKPKYKLFSYFFPFPFFLLIFLWLYRYIFQYSNQRNTIQILQQPKQMDFPKICRDACTNCSQYAANEYTYNFCGFHRAILSLHFYSVLSFLPYRYILSLMKIRSSKNSINSVATRNPIIKILWQTAK